ncbi:MAG: histidine phosphatase family protein [Hamadaea sp.]|nr:histidine phosphatase family protein [Hamadaea sp.]
MVPWHQPRAERCLRRQVRARRRDPVSAGGTRRTVPLRPTRRGSLPFRSFHRRRRPLRRGSSGGCLRRETDVRPSAPTRRSHRRPALHHRWSDPKPILESASRRHSRCSPRTALFRRTGLRHGRAGRSRGRPAQRHRPPHDPARHPCSAASSSRRPVQFRVRGLRRRVDDPRLDRRRPVPECLGVRVKTVVLVRHGRTAWHHPNRYTGRSDIPLDEVGEQQATALARWATGRGFTALAASDLVRAVATAMPVAAATGLHLRTDPRLRELDFGDAEGATLDEMDPDVAAAFRRDPVAHHLPHGEHPADAVRRFQSGLADVTAAAQGTALVVCHSTIIRLVVCAALGLPLAEYRRRLPSLAPTGTVVLGLSDDGTPSALLAYNGRS